MRLGLANNPFLSTAAEFIRRQFQSLWASRVAKPVSAAAPCPAQRPASEQWSRIAGVLSEAQSRARRAVDTHHNAADQLDAATYALQRLREEMAPAFQFTIARPAPPAPTAFRREQFRRREPLAA